MMHVQAYASWLQRGRHLHFAEQRGSPDPTIFANLVVCAAQFTAFEHRYNDSADSARPFDWRFTAMTSAGPTTASLPDSRRTNGRGHKSYVDRGWGDVYRSDAVRSCLPLSRCAGCGLEGRDLHDPSG